MKSKMLWKKIVFYIIVVVIWQIVGDLNFWPNELFGV